MNDNNNQIENLYTRLQQSINDNNDEIILKLSEQILSKQQDEKVKKCHLIALLKTEKLQQFQQEFSNLPINDDQSQYWQAYSLYKQEKYEECIKFCQQQQSQIQFFLLLAQSYNKLGQYQTAVEIYQQTLKKFPKTQDYQDILVNLIAASVSSKVKMKYFFFLKNKKKHKDLQEISKSIVQDFIKNSKNQEQTREFIYNYAFLLANLHQTEDSLLLQRRFQQIIQKENDKEDEIISVLQSDYNDFLNHKVYQGEELEKKIKQYEAFQKINTQDKNLKAVLNNNIVFFKSLSKSDHFSESLRLLEDCISNKYKQTSEQIFLFKLNKLILYIQKGKYNEGLNLLQEIEKKYPQNLLFQEFSLKQRIHIFLLLAEMAKQMNQQDKIITLFNSLFENNPSVYENEVLICFMFSQLIKNKQNEQHNEQVLQKIGQNTKNPQILSFLADFYAKSNPILAIEMFEKLISKFSKERVFQQKLAKLYANNGNLEKAEKLLESIEFDLINDYNELTKLESELALSKIQTKSGSTTNIAKKIQKKKKKRIRFPKNYDPKNPPVNQPDPERWLPKYERKDFKRKKGQMGGKTQGSAAVDMLATKATFNAGNTTSHQQVSSNKNKKPNKRKK
ncbi:hypothetical protein IMG5_047910 [Ichthyophthirius multifiliis]|uniref:Signal recognition particle subunit SRP72 n=1 Tax=Ichthyophthirius multifiliis TaxID=5932 RepID=G0QME2_ICHMU|nr:hypothetical protein IMG5_047910 [Ichthyophthirius multifiliis]EGR33611.1 hypothetical protein IMG5_047910 [Ichthyophthirius multifiliis]|eukprot:XP_004037597.1 hypothetical protein IMG5_047910 [Ichthyophthirius multifiliis]